ncbi:hypothetical protein BLM37_04655 [Candidatus Gracilibacteria bacterium GN02-873]|nr:hypothetical protein BLM37_04655 [Candidatus Gracilibacteria bacterium GN02-873]
MTPTQPQFKDEPGLNSPKLGRKQIITEEIQWENIKGKPEIVTKNNFDILQQSLDQALEKIQSLEQRITALEQKP